MLAERGGFEPPVQLLTVQRFSKPPPSATRPPLRGWFSQSTMVKEIPITASIAIIYKPQILNGPNGVAYWQFSQWH